MKTVVRTHSKKATAPKLQSCYTRERLEFAQTEAKQRGRACIHATVMEFEAVSHLEARYAEHIRQLCKEELLEIIRVEFNRVVEDIYELRDEMLILGGKALKAKTIEKSNEYLTESHKIYNSICFISNKFKERYNQMSKVGGLK